MLTEQKRLISVLIDRISNPKDQLVHRNMILCLRNSRRKKIFHEITGGTTINCRLAAKEKSYERVYAVN